MAFSLSVSRASVRWFLQVAIALCVVITPLRAITAQTGGLFLLVPFGARAIGVGEAVSADTALGSEGIWWNPAAIARMPSREITFQNSRTVLAPSSNMLTLAFPSRVIGSLAVSGYIVDYGDQEATDVNSGASVGLISTRNYLISATYATPVGKRLGLGVTYKLLMLRSACAGTCGDFPVLSGRTSAIDVGAQYVVPSAFPLSIGLSVRNVGPKLQVRDQPQADPLPRVIQFGATSRLPIASVTASGASIDVSADVMRAPSAVLSADETMFGVGVSLGYKDQYFIRGGYKKQQGDAGGPSFGFGIQRGAFGLDFARRLDRLSSSLGETPTYVALRARF